MENQEMTKKRFEDMFKNEIDYYEKQTRQDDKIERIIEELNINNGDTIIDLGTGTGYIAFNIAKAFPKVNVVGVDILSDTLRRNNEIAIREGIKNLKFQQTDGVNLSFEDKSVDCIVSRFAIHHFRNIEKSFREFSRVLKTGGKLFISDPTPNEEDKEKFIDKFMQLSNDGHITFYTKSEFDELAKKSNFDLDKYYYSEVTFPSKNRTKGYLEIKDDICDELLNGYNFKMINEEVWVTEKVINLSYIKNIY